MKIKVTSAIVCLSMGIFLSACKHRIDPAEIQILTDENMALEQKLPDIMFKKQIQSEKEKKYSDMITSIDPKKKAAYEKDNSLKSSMNSINEKMDKTAKQYEENCNLLTTSVESNASFIASIPNSGQDEQAVKSDWQQRMGAFNGVEKTNDDLQKEMTGLLQQYGELTKQAIKKYGKIETSKGRVKKRKK